MRRSSVVLCAGVLGLAGCADDDFGMERPTSDASASAVDQSQPAVSDASGGDAASTADLSAAEGGGTEGDSGDATDGGTGVDLAGEGNADAAGDA